MAKLRSASKHRDAAVIGWMARWKIAQTFGRFLRRMDLAEIHHRAEPELFWCRLHRNEKGRVVGGLLPLDQAADIDRTYRIGKTNYPAGRCKEHAAVQADEVMDVHEWANDDKELDLKELIGDR